MARVSPLMIAPPLIFAALAFMFYTGMNREDPRALPSAIAGNPAPPLVLSELAGLPGFDDASLREPGVKLVNYWASWCAPCRVEHPNLTKLASEGVTIYGINYKDDPVKALNFLSELGNPYIGIGADDSGRTALDWGLYGVPETYVIDSNGIIVLRFAGPITDRVLESTILPAIAGASEP